MGWGGIIAGALAAGAAGAGEAMANDALLQQKDEMERAREERLSQLRMKEMEASQTRAGQIARENYTFQKDADLANLPKELQIKTEGKVHEQEALAPGEEKAYKAKLEAARESEQKMREWEASPEGLKATRAIAQAKHIVDPSYAVQIDADGFMYGIDVRTGKTKSIADADGNQLRASKVPEAQRLAANAAFAEAKQLETEAAKSESDPIKLVNDQGKREAAAMRKRAAEAQSFAMKALSGNMTAEEMQKGWKPEQAAAPTAVPNLDQINAMKKNINDPGIRAQFVAKFGANALQQIDEAMKKAPATTPAAPSPRFL